MMTALAKYGCDVGMSALILTISNLKEHRSTRKICDLQRKTGKLSTTTNTATVGTTNKTYPFSITVGSCNLGNKLLIDEVTCDDGGYVSQLISSVGDSGGVDIAKYTATARPSA